MKFQKNKLVDVLFVLPENPGVYLFMDEDGEIIYVGKAKNLKKRVSSYFMKKLTGKTRILVGKVTDIKHIIVDYVSANPSGPLQLGHGRGAALGDTLCRV